MAISFQEEKLVDTLPEPFGKLECEEGGRTVLPRFDRTDRLARHADEGGELLLRQPAFGAGHLQPVTKPLNGHFR
jgi:hypothetical protein